MSADHSGEGQRHHSLLIRGLHTKKRQDAPQKTAAGDGRKVVKLRSKCSYAPERSCIGSEASIAQKPSTINTPPSPPACFSFQCQFCGHETLLSPHAANTKAKSAGYQPAYPASPSTHASTQLADPDRWLYFSRAQQKQLAKQRAKLIVDSAELALQNLYNLSDSTRSYPPESDLSPPNTSCAVSSSEQASMETRGIASTPKKGDDDVQRTFFVDDGSAAPESNTQSRPRSRRGSFRQTISQIADAGARRFSHDTPRPALSSGYPPQRKSWVFPRRASTSTPAPAYPQAPSQYYQDPEARMKLKTYLSSPQKFEEMLQFGFPSAPKNEAFLPPKTPRTSLQLVSQIPKSSASNDVPKFLKNNSLSFLDDSNDDEDYDVDEEYYEGFHEHADDLEEHGMGDDELSDRDDDADNDSLEIDSPITPDYQEEFSSKLPPFYSSNTTPGRDGRVDLSTLPRKFQEPDSPSWPASRQMTLRMTLTRPELRTYEDEYLPYQHSPPHYGQDPFALEPLPKPKNNARPVKGNSKEQENGKVRNLFRRMKPSSNRR